MGIFSKIKAFFYGRGKGDGQETDINKPVTNPQLKAAFARFNQLKTETNLQLLISELRTATFLMIVLNDGFEIKRTSEKGKWVIEKGSSIKFYQINNTEGVLFYPLFTDWDEIDLWFKTREGFAGFVSPAIASFEFILMSGTAHGLVINPSSDNWTMERKQIEELIKDSPQ